VSHAVKLTRRDVEALEMAANACDSINEDGLCDCPSCDTIRAIPKRLRAIAARAKRGAA
jgi:hypothetical protein